ncbi:MAG: geranyl transferase [Legionellales bacterium]|nr:geranyl transferase [Legionellales bacterium]HAG61447.1 geranyl transferase [Coxiellaceae bacterium]
MSKTAPSQTNWLSFCQSTIENYLNEILPSTQQLTPSKLCEAMRYAVLNGGKRLRPALVYAVGTDLDTPLTHLHPPAAAVELLHCYSLIHDDLPAMDNDDLRRGKPTCHKAFDEATAILAGNALQSLAFNLLAHQNLPNKNSLAMIQELSQLTGHNGTIGGQALDLKAEVIKPSLQELETIHALKTAALLQASISLGALTSNKLSPQDTSSLNQIAQTLGLAFQIQDDILDLTSNTETLGKQTHADTKLNKATYPSLTSLTQAQHTVQELIDQCYTILSQLPFSMEKLRLIIDTVKNRKS